MPKEIAHFTMARMARDAMTEAQAPFDRAVARYPSLFVLGAVTPDINFYCMAGPGAKKIQALSAPFHRTDRRALAPVLAFLDRRLARNPRDLPALALAAGVVCHIMADTLFHPMVYYFAGMDDLHPGATIRHRQFETALDLYFWQDGRKDHWLLKRLSAVELPRRDLVRLLADLYNAAPLGGTRAVRRALRWHTGIQYLFFAPWMKAVMTAFERLGRPLSGKATGLVYPFSQGFDLPFFSGPVSFYDPCTGEKTRGTVKGMAREAAGNALTVLALAGQTMHRNTRLADSLPAHPDLPRVRPGLPARGFRIWKEEENIMPRIYRGFTPPF